MNESQKPNDILIATISNPNASVMDLLLNNITAENTQFLDPDTYKQSKYIQKAFSDENGVFNNDAFEKAYKISYEKFSELNDENMFNNLMTKVSYSPTNIYRDVNRTNLVSDYAPSYRKINNPLEVAIGHEGLNKVSEAQKTPEELAQGNRIYDPFLKKFIDKTPESMSLKDKIFGRTLVYARYAEDEKDEYGVEHYKGEWKRDSNGRFYTEYLDDKDLGGRQVVALADILTKEGSKINLLDFLDSDGYTKSATGIAMKTIFLIAPYLIPGVNNFWGAATAIWGVGSALPTIAKSFGAVFGLDENAPTYKALTTAENWRNKFTYSQSYEGRNGLFNLEQLANIVGDTAGLLYQQKAAAKLSKLFRDTKTMPSIAEMKRQNDIGSRFSLGYMAITQGADMYNDAIMHGYDTRTAGLTSIMAMSAAYEIMRFNESKFGFGTWFLDKTTGYNQEVSKWSVRKGALKFWEQVQKETQAVVNSGDKNALQGLATKLRVGWLKTIGHTEDFWKSMINEGVEEVTEEIVNDTVKGLIDTAEWLGWTPKQGSFGGWSNVFSKQGAERYLATLVGGAIGGGIFAGQGKWERRLLGLTIETPDLDYFIQTGLSDLVIEELLRIGKAFGDKSSFAKINVGGQEISLMGEGADTNMGMVTQEAINLVKSKEEAFRDAYKYIGINQFKEQVIHNPEHYLYDLFAGYESSEDGLDEFTYRLLNSVDLDGKIKSSVDRVNQVGEVMLQDFGKVINGLAEAKEALKNAKEAKDHEAEANAKKQVEELIKRVQEFFNGNKSFWYKVKHNIWRHEEYHLGLFSGGTNALLNGLELFASAVHNIDNLEELKTKNKDLYDKIKKEYDAMAERQAHGYDKTEFNDTLDASVNAYLQLNKIVNPILSQAANDHYIDIMAQDFASETTRDFYGNFDKQLEGFTDNERYIKKDALNVDGTIKNEFINPDGTINIDAFDNREAIDRGANGSVSLASVRINYLKNHTDRAAVKSVNESPRSFTFTRGIKFDIGKQLIDEGVVSFTFGDLFDDSDKKEVMEAYAEIINFIASHNFKAGNFTSQDIDIILELAENMLRQGSMYSSFANKIQDVRRKKNDPDKHLTLDQLVIDSSHNLASSEDVKKAVNLAVNSMNTQAYKSMKDFFQKQSQISQLAFEKMEDWARGMLTIYENALINTNVYKTIGIGIDTMLKIAKAFNYDYNDIYGNEEKVASVLTPEEIAQVSFVDDSTGDTQYDSSLITFIVQEFVEAINNAGLGFYNGTTIESDYLDYLDIREELESKVTNKVNPVIAALNKILWTQTRKFEDGKELKYQDVLQYLNDTKSLVYSAKDLNSIGINDEDLKVIIPNINRAINLLQTAISFSQKTVIGTDPSLNEMLEEFVTAYPNQTGFKSEEFKSFDMDYIMTLRKECAEISERLNRLHALVEVTAFNKVETSFIKNAKVNEACLVFLQELSDITFESEILETLSVDDDDYTHLPEITDEDMNSGGDPRATVEVWLTKLFKQFDKIKDPEQRLLAKIALIDELTERYKNNLKSNYYADDQLMEIPESNLSNAMAAYTMHWIAASLSNSPDTIRLKYNELLFDENNKKIAWDGAQERVIEMGMSDFIDKDGLITHLNDRLYEIQGGDGLVLSSDKKEIIHIPRKRDRSSVFIDSGAGVGKTTVITNFLAQITREYETEDKHGKWLCCAVNTQKINDLQKSLNFVNGEIATGFYEDASGGNSLFQLAFSPETANILIKAGSEIKEKVDLAYQAVVDRCFDDDTMTPDEFSLQKSDWIDLADGKIKMRAVLVVKRNVNSAGNVSIEVDVAAPEFDFTDCPLIVNNSFKDSRIVIDEITQCDPLVLELLNQMHDGKLESGEPTGIKFLKLGDNQQTGYKIDLTVNKTGGTLSFNFNINNFYCNRIPYISSAMRFNTSANTNNANIIRDSARTSKGMLIDPVNPIQVDEVADEVYEYWRHHKLQYNLSSPDLYGGHQVVFSSPSLDNTAEFKKSIEFIKNALKPGEKIGVLVNKDNKNEFLSKWDSFGYSRDLLDIFVEDEGRSILGYEINNLIIYKLEGNTRSIDIDIDYSRINTYSTRAKNFTLIYEDRPNQLFTLMGVTSEATSLIVKDTLNEAIVAAVNEKYRNYINNLNRFVEDRVKELYPEFELKALEKEEVSEPEASSSEELEEDDADTSFEEEDVEKKVIPTTFSHGATVPTPSGPLSYGSIYDNGRYLIQVINDKNIFAITSNSLSNGTKMFSEFEEYATFLGDGVMSNGDESKNHPINPVIQKDGSYSFAAMYQNIIANYNSDSSNLDFIGFLHYLQKSGIFDITSATIIDEASARRELLPWLNSFVRLKGEIAGNRNFKNKTFKSLRSYRIYMPKNGVILYDKPNDNITTGTYSTQLLQCIVDHFEVVDLSGRKTIIDATENPFIISIGTYKTYDGIREPDGTDEEIEAKLRDPKYKHDMHYFNDVKQGEYKNLSGIPLEVDASGDYSDKTIQLVSKLITPILQMHGYDTNPDSEQFQRALHNFINNNQYTGRDGKEYLIPYTKFTDFRAYVLGEKNSLGHNGVVGHQVGLNYFLNLGYEIELDSTGKKKAYVWKHKNEESFNDFWKFYQSFMTWSPTDDAEKELIKNQLREMFYGNVYWIPIVHPNGSRILLASYKRDGTIADLNNKDMATRNEIRSFLEMTYNIFKEDRSPSWRSGLEYLPRYVNKPGKGSVLMYGRHERTPETRKNARESCNTLIGRLKKILEAFNNGTGLFKDSTNDYSEDAEIKLVKAAFETLINLGIQDTQYLSSPKGVTHADFDAAHSEFAKAYKVLFEFAKNGKYKDTELAQLLKQYAVSNFTGLERVGGKDIRQTKTLQTSDLDVLYANRIYEPPRYMFLNMHTAVVGNTIQNENEIIKKLIEKHKPKKPGSGSGGLTLPAGATKEAYDNLISQLDNFAAMCGDNPELFNSIFDTSKLLNWEKITIYSYMLKNDYTNILSRISDWNEESTTSCATGGITPGAASGPKSGRRRGRGAKKK